MTRGVNWTPAEDAILFEERAKGTIFKIIADMIGRPLNGCEQRYTILKRRMPDHEVRRKTGASATSKPKAIRDYSAVVSCLRCSTEFKSPDRRKIRVCQSCKYSEDWKSTDAFSRNAGYATPARMSF